MKLGILQTDDVRAEWVEQFGEYPDMFVRLLTEADPTLEFVRYDVQRGQYPNTIDEVDAYLITGSKSSVYDDKEWIAQLMDFVRTLRAQRKKVVGICFGHQLIAHALGGKTEKATQGWGVGRHTVSVTDAGSAYADPGSDFSLLVSHQDQVTQPATGAKVLAGSEFCPVAMCELDEHMLTFQGHPEFVPGYSQAILDLRREIYGEELYQQGVSSLSASTDEKKIARWITEFIRA